MANEPMAEQVAAKEAGLPLGEVIQPKFTKSYTLAQELPKGKAPRHIFIFLDGTWNEERTLTGAATPTNVLRMYQELSHDTDIPETNAGVSRVIARYYRGVGNRQDNIAADRLWFGFNGKDEERIRRAALAGLYQDYKSKSDNIYIIGFSRGAACARLLARDICLNGLPPKLEVHTEHFANLLTGQIEPRVIDAKRLGEESGAHKPRIAFLGCWDTVDAFVLPSRFPQEGGWNKFKDNAVRYFKSVVFPRLTGKERFRGNENEIPENVDTAVHCVAMDETRHAFLPTLMPYAQNVEEVWFPGVHSDVGGGYDDNLLAQAPYQFMKSRLIAAAAAHGLKDVNLFKSDETKKTSDEYCFHFHGLNAGFERMKDLLGFGASMRRIRVLGAPDESVKPKIHSSLQSIMNSGSVFAANHNNKRMWTITYDPYSVRELRDNFEIAYDVVKAQPSDKPKGLNA